MKILLLEDDQPTSEFLADTLSTHHYAVDAIADGAVGLDLASRWPYDLLILDWLMPSLDGVEVCRRLRAQGNGTPILMLTVKDAEPDIVAALDAGADDYLVKTCQATQLLARVRALLRRGSNQAASPVLTWGPLQLDPALGQVTYQQRIVPCRPKEYELLELFLRHPQRLLTRSAIIDHLWPLEESPVEGSVTNLIKDLRQRLKQAGLRVNPIETVYGLGYRLRAQPETDVPSAAADARRRNGPASLTATMERATRRFQASLAERLALLEQTARSLQAGDLSPQQQHQAWAEAHKLAGGLGLFGYDQASAVTEAIEHLLQTATRPDQRLAECLWQRLQDLHQALSQPMEEDPAGPSMDKPTDPPLHGPE
ncbi:MAG TPA: response regulator [Leptolyngbyaceae cyanobacterium M65_K2018_010]|nr:response regulator [Leptolyngbyaceae cyanobacterium M65_K2018_010]